MANTIGSTALNIGANVGGLQSGLSTALSSVQSFSQGVRVELAAATAGFSELIGIITAVAGALTGAALVGKIHDVANSIHEADLEAKAFGTSFEFINALQSSGIDNARQSLRKLSTQLEKMTSGSADAIKNFRMIGLEAEQLRGLSFERQFEMAAEAIGKMPPGMERTSVATKLLGREFTVLLAKFGSGPGALQAMKEQAERFGTALNSGQVERVEEMTSAWRQVSQSIRGVWMQITASLAPAFSVIYSLVARLIQFFRAMIQPWLDLAATVGGFISDVLEPVWGAVDYLITLFGKVPGTASIIKDVLVGAFRIVVEAIRPIAIAFGYVVDALSIGIGTILDSCIAPLLRGFNTLVDALGGMLNTFASFGRFIPGIGGMIENANAAMQRFRNTTRDAAASISASGQAMANVQLGQSADGINQFFDRLARGRQEVAEIGLGGGFAGLTADIRAAGDALEKANRDFGKTKEEIQIIELQERARREGAQWDLGVREQMARLQEQANRNMAQNISAQNDPTIKLNEDLERLQELYRSGALSAQNFAIAQNRVLNQAERAVGLGHEMKPQAALQRGSQQAFEVVARFQMQGANQQSPQERALAVQQQQLAIGREQVQLARQQLVALGRPAPDFLP